MQTVLLAGQIRMRDSRNRRYSMQLMSERDLMLFMKSGVFQQFQISQSVCGRFLLRITLTIEKDEFVLAGTRNKPREWASLDTLAKHIESKYAGPFPILLSLRSSS